jgi:hypothetical protein
LTKKNPQTLKQQYGAVIDTIDVSQLVHSNNTIGMEALAQDLTPKSFTKLDEPSDASPKREYEPVTLPENTRFSFDYSETARKLTKRID